MLQSVLEKGSTLFSTVAPRFLGPGRQNLERPSTKRQACLLVLAVAALALAPAQDRGRVGKPFGAKVVYTADGDTLELIPDGEKAAIRIRLEGIDAPELGEAFSRDAQSFLRALVTNQRVRVEGRDVDRYGRLVARVAAEGLP